MEKILSHSFEMTRIVIPSGNARNLSPQYFHSLEACVKLMNQFVEPAQRILSSEPVAQLYTRTVTSDKF